MFLLSRTIKNASFSLRYKATQLSHSISSGLRHRSELYNKQRLEQLETLLTTPRKEKMVRQSFRLEQVLKTAQKLALAEERDDIVTDLLSAFSSDGVVKFFSSIEIEEIPQLEVKMGGYLIFKDEIALKPSKLFEDVMERIFRRWNLSLETARRTIVDTYLLEAVDHKYDPKTYDTKKDKLAIYPEYYVRPQNFERDLTLRGSIDYISAERAEPNNLSLQAGHSLPSNCVFCAVEAKKDESFAQGTGELLGQMKALHKREKKPINGVLTDGLRWMFYHFDDNMYYESEIMYYKFHSNIILGALHYWVRGEIPADNLFEKVNQID
ncbi:16365_t:CDS:2 [Funneliformis mosseae]|uniref:16365_t:CDS:1 n=1 Tax=Funneliformis mosseae TaxID=27381 RepID=A0A9N9CME4_FUNMO|nr:16365_t:CDS:2 [Funneliformis mosseae]